MLQNPRKTTVEINLHGGQALGNMVRQRLKHPRIRAKILCLNPGETRLLLSPPARPHSK